MTLSQLWAVQAGIFPEAIEHEGSQSQGVTIHWTDLLLGSSVSMVTMGGGEEGPCGEEGQWH